MTDIEWPGIEPKEAKAAADTENQTLDTLTRKEILAVLINYAPDARPMLLDPNRPKPPNRSEAYAIRDFIVNRLTITAEVTEAWKGAEGWPKVDSRRTAALALDDRHTRASHLVLYYLNHEADEHTKVEAKAESEGWLDHIGADEANAVTMVDFMEATGKSEKWCRNTLSLGVRRGIVMMGERRTRKAGSATKVYWRAASDDVSDDSE